VVDIHARSYYGGKGFPSYDEATIAARAIPRHLRPFGVYIVNGGFPGNNDGSDGTSYKPETIYRPI
jgi:hypothetical protein